jgi:hypothetical protein
MARPRKHKENKIELFPFLSVLICTIGVLTLILISSVLGQVDAVVDTAEKYGGIVRQLGKINSQISQWQSAVESKKEKAEDLAEDLDEAEQRFGELGRIDEGKHQGMYHALTNAVKKTQDAEDDTQNIKIKIEAEDPDGVYRGNATPDAIKQLAGLKEKLNAINLEKDAAEARIGVLNKKKKGIEKETAEVKKELDKEDPDNKLRKKTTSSRERLKRIEDDLKETNADIEKLKTIIPDTDKKLQTAKVKLDKLPKAFNVFQGGRGVGFKARYAECSKNWVKLDPDRKGGGHLLNLANGNFRDQNKFKAFLLEIKADRAVRLVLLIRPSGVDKKDTSGVNNYSLAKKIAEGQGLTPGYLALPREDMKIPFRD